MKILIFGASGSGTTTLGKEIEKKAYFKHLDADDYYWKLTEPPYMKKYSLEERNKSLRKDFKKYKNVIVSGSMVSWGKEWETAFDLAIFLYLENNTRMKRLRTREMERYGKRLLTDGKIKRNSDEFLNWANQYEHPNFNGRSLKVHSDWMKLLNCEVLKIDGAAELNKKANMVLTEIKKLQATT